ncbi:nitrilase [Streptomyces sp. NPDC127079]|uniref:nitrilase n=1 Tax=Streptomyces sp. NPDC127079 TaxID=3347132 RepID=UPI003652576B
MTIDIDASIARVTTRKSSKKVANIQAHRPGEAHVAVCQVDAGRWASLERTAEVRTDAAAVEDAVARYAHRHGRTPAPDPKRVVIEITITRTMGVTSLSQPTPSARTA